MLALLLAATAATTPVPPPDSSTVYRMVLMRAAPGRLLELIDFLRSRLPVLTAAGDEAPLILRHSQGDQWDLMMLQPVGSLAAYYSEAAQSRRMRAMQAAGVAPESFEQRMHELLSWREEEFVTGPPLAELRAHDRGAGYYHIEMFVALAGKYDDLVRARQMESQYLAGVGLPTDLVFTRLSGASWDVFTIGFYRNLQHYAEPVTLSEAAQDSVARAAGFRNRNDLGPSLRALINYHHDTLAGRVHP